MSPPENPSPAAPAEPSQPPPAAAAAKGKGKKKDEKKDDDLSEEDLALKEQLELYVVLAQDADPVVQKYALESMRKEIRSATSSLISVPKPLKFLRPHFGTLKSYFETMPESELKKYMADILSVLALTMSIEGGESLKYRLLGSEGDIGSWGHEYVRMDPRQSNVGEGSKGQFTGGNIGAYQPGWNLYMYGYQPPPGWFPQGFQPRPPNVAMMNPNGYAPEGFQQGEIPEAYVHHSEADLEEVPATTAKTGTKKSVTRTKLSNFNPDEDKNLVKSWLESRDPITSTGQKRDRMWVRIIERYNSRRASNPARSLRSLQSRWDRIRAEVTLFASYYADSIRENPSGMSDADKTTHAVGNFADVEQCKFGFLHCWELMKDAPKWQDPSARDIAAAARGEGFGEESTAGTDTMDHAEGQSSPVRSGAQARRPMGRDSAKAAKKKANCDAGSTPSAEHAARMQDLSLQKNSIMQEEAVRKNDRFQQLASIDEKRFEEMRRHNEALLQIEKEKIQLMREKQEDERIKEEKKEDERILKVDLDACPPPLRLYYQTLQEEIVEKIAARRRRRQAS